MTNNRLRKELLEGFEGLAKVGLVGGATMKKLRKDLLPQPKRLSPAGIKRLRKRYNISQGVLAELMCVNLSTIQKWEQGIKQPSNLALKLLSIIDKKGLEVLVDLE